MTTITLNDKIGSRSLKHLNLFVALAGSEQVIAKFEGGTLPGLFQVIRADFTKNGKWSHNTWTVEPADGVSLFTIAQDWETGKWLNSQTWGAAMAEFIQKAKRAEDGYGMGASSLLEVTAITRFIRSEWPGLAAKLDAAQDATATTSPSTAIAALIAAQSEKALAQREQAALAAEVAALEQAETLKREAAETRERTAKAKDMMKRGASLADLKALLSA